MTLASCIALAAVTIGTWNGQWFPSGRAEHRAAPETEAATIAAAGRALREGIDRADPSGTNDLILCFNEIRGPKAANELCRAIGRTNLSVAVITAYRRRDRFDQQQDVIATTLPVSSATWSRWKTGRDKDLTPPRGYARAELLLSPTTTATVYCVHLKSNYRQTSKTATANREKRTRAVNQLIAQERSVNKGSREAPVILAGDFNADAWNREYEGETIFAALARAGFVNVLESLPKDSRVTYPKRGKWGLTALDYIFLRGVEPSGPPTIGSADGVSDHNPVFVTIR